MKMYLPIKITLLEPIRVTQTHAKKGQNMSSNYISGSVIRGALISTFINELDVFKDELLKGKIYFLNAYPMVNNMRSLPMPNCFYAKKIELRQNADTTSFRVGLDNPIVDGDIAIKSNDFVAFGTPNYRTKVSIREDLYLDIRRDENNHLFRYEAIEQGQIFMSYLVYEHINKDLIEQIKLIDELYLGGRRGTGFGRCKINIMQALSYNPEQTEIEDSNDIDILALSDAFLYDNRLQPVITLDKDTVKSTFGIEISQIYQSVQSDAQSSFNSKWMARTPFNQVIKAGSVFRIKSSNAIDTKALTKKLSIGIGGRTSEGFGRFCVLNRIETIVFENTQVDSTTKLIGVQWKTEENDLTIARINNQIQRLPYSEAKINKIAEAKNIFANEKLNNAFLSDIRLKLMQVNQKATRNEAIEMIKSYFDHIEGKVESKRGKQLRTSKNGDLKENILEYIEKGDYHEQIANLIEAFRLLMRGAVR